jgi:predicted RNA binding protein YcfA (HicA-like mRNA interferase family)
VSRERKLADRLRARPSEMSFDDVRRVLEDHGWQIRSRGKHVVFAKSGRGHLAVPTVSGRKVKRYILIQICELLGLDEVERGSDDTESA